VNSKPKESCYDQMWFSSPHSGQFTFVSHCFKLSKPYSNPKCENKWNPPANRGRLRWAVAKWCVMGFWIGLLGSENFDQNGWVGWRRLWSNRPRWHCPTAKPHLWLNCVAGRQLKVDYVNIVLGLRRPPG